MAGKETRPETLAMARLVAWIDSIDLPMFVVSHVEGASLDAAPGDRMEYVHANAALGRAANVSTSIFPGKTALELFPARMAESIDANYRRCLNGVASHSYEECLLIEGRETWWETTLSKPEGFDGRAVMGVAIPITDRKKREFADAEALADLNARFDELRLFSTMAAHDARSPLATVSSLIDLVLEDFKDMGDGKRELLKLATNTVEEALSQISATLERARSLQADVDVHKEIDLARLSSDIAAMVDPEANLSINVPEKLIKCDEVMIQMGLRNLMTNAARFCRGRIEVRVSEGHTRDMLMIDVADDGPGLPEGTSVQDLTRQGEAREGVHGFGLGAVSKLINSRGGSLELVAADPANELVGSLGGAQFRMIMPGQLLAHSEIGSPENLRQNALPLAANG